MKHNLDDDEFNALLGMFGSQQAKFKKLRPQTISFKISYCFVNIYSVVIIAIYFILTNFFAGHANQDFLQSGYMDVLDGRTLGLLFLLFAFNATFFVGQGFRLLPIIMLVYLANSSFDGLVLVFGDYSMKDIPIFAGFFLTSPLLMLGLLYAVFKYDPSV
jgi:hypothetical protein